MTVRKITPQQINKPHLPAPYMLEPLNEVFPVTSAPSKLAFVKFTYEFAE
jgi:hypothetical protein